MKNLKSKEGNSMVEFFVVIGVCAYLVLYHFLFTDSTLKLSFQNVSSEYISKDTVVIDD